MKKTSLLDQIRQFGLPEQQKALVTSKGEVTFDELSGLRRSFHGKRIALMCSNVMETVASIVSADTSAQCIAVFPEQISAEEMKTLLDSGKFDLIVSDQPQEILRLLGASTIPVVGAESTMAGGVDQDLQVNQDVQTITEWLVPTSGTTSVPKLVKHTTQSLGRAISPHQARTDQDEVWGLLYDVARFAGLQVLFQSVFSGKTLVVPPAGVPLFERVAFLAQNGVTHLSATPTLWRKILMVKGANRLPLEQITLGGEAADQMILSALKGTYPTARVTHIYASTEAGVGFWVSDGRAGFPTTFLERNPGRPELAVRDGSLWVRSEGTGRGYANATHPNDDGWVNTGDLVEVREDRFFILGRGDQTLNIGGDKVIVEHVRAVVLECDLVSDAYVFGRSNPITGTIVATDIVLAEGVDSALARQKIDDFLRGRVRETHRPRVIRFVDEIAMSSTGKAVAQNGR